MRRLARVATRYRILILDEAYTPNILPLDWAGRVNLIPSKPEWVLQIPDSNPKPSR